MSRLSQFLGDQSSPIDSYQINTPHSVGYSDNNSSMENKSRKRGKRRRQRDNSSQGRWTDDEHKLFVEGNHPIQFFTEKLKYLVNFYPFLENN